MRPHLALTTCCCCPGTPQVIEKAKVVGCYDDLVKFLLMVRKKVKEAKVDTELAYAYARVRRQPNLTAKCGCWRYLFGFPPAAGGLVHAWLRLLYGRQPTTPTAPPHKSCWCH